MKSSLLAFALVVVAAFLEAQLIPDDCSLKFGGSDRAAVKNRSPQDGSGYSVANGGNPISVDSFFKFACRLDQRIPDAWRQNAPAEAQTSAIPGFEDVKMVVAGYLLGVRFEGQPGGDRDFHCEISDSQAWNSPHLIVEIPPGQAYCDARKYVWSLVLADANQAGKQPPTKGWVFHNPPEVHVWGFPLWDLHHGRLDTCNQNGNRGIRLNPGDPSMVRGLWEVHPVIKATAH